MRIDIIISGLIDAQHGYPCQRFAQLFNRFDGEGNIQLTFDINMSNQTSLDFLD